MFNDRSTTRVLLVSAGVFFSLGLIAAIGPTLPELARNNDISLAAAGAIFTALFLGAIPAQVITGWLNDRFGPKPVLLAGLLVLAVGLLGATLSHFLPLTLACMVFAGFGDGVLVVGANVIVAQSFSRRRASALNLLNVFYGVGAMAGPAIAGRSIVIWGTALPALWSLSVVLVLGGSFGPVFPTVLAIITARFPVGAGRAASVVIATGSVGGMIIPLLQGALLEGIGAQSLAQIVVVDTFLMLLLLGTFSLYERRKREVVAQTIMGSPAAK